MTNEAMQLMAEAMKVTKLRGGFSAAEVGARIGLSQLQSENAARELSNVGVLELGFDFSAEFSREYRKAHAPAEPKAAKAPKARAAKAAKPAKPRKRKPAVTA